MVLASGFMIETTNTDTFCVSCHVMAPFRTSWQDAVHGGQNPQGFAAQCVDCHLPHGDFFQFLTVKAITGTSDLVHNLYIDPKTYDWAGASEKNRLKFTFDNACRRCHHTSVTFSKLGLLFSVGLSSGRINLKNIMEFILQVFFNEFNEL
ncbi:MAG: hypothetical protein SRB1_01673 [Desulfobacteraceae bacterium Eth-SRB1]|nr:MAG: hypothetical protein SRB1_01673 [Desulfobacteraceae bacterium Eth-SRB1]